MESILGSYRSRVSVHANHEALTRHSPSLTVARPGSPRSRGASVLKRRSVGEREGELGADICSFFLPSSRAGNKGVRNQGTFMSLSRRRPHETCLAPAAQLV